MMKTWERCHLSALKRLQTEDILLIFFAAAVTIPINNAKYVNQPKKNYKPLYNCIAITCKICLQLITMLS